MTIARTAKILALSTATAIAITSGFSTQASAQTLMDLLFRDRARQEPPVEVVPAPPKPAKVAPPPRIAGPQYYTYKTDPLVPVDFASIVPVREREGAALSEVELDHTAVGSTIEDRIEEVLEEAKSTAGAPSQPAATEIQIPAGTGPEIAAEQLTEDRVRQLEDVSLLAEKNIAEALVAYYSQEPTLIWIADAGVNEKAQSAIATLRQAETEGLDPNDYALAVPAADADERQLLAFEMELSARLLRYGRDALNGRIDPNRISGYHDFKAKEFDGVEWLRAARDSGDVTTFLAQQHPQNAYYRALRDELGRLRQSAENDIVIEPKTVVKPGQTNPEFTKILALIDRRADDAFRSEFGVLLADHLGTETYSQELVPLIKAAQRQAGVGDDGVIGPRTVLALAGESKASSIAKVEAAMERIRWLPSDLSDRYVFINTPSFEAYYVEDGEQKLAMRTVVGRLDTQTYFFQDEISYVEFHPYWGMPRSILINSYLPRVLKDPTYFDRNGYEVVGQNGQVVSSTSVNWGAYGSKIPFNVRQRPGPNNALGEMKIMFPNRHAIYMHDTPEKHLFNRENRALSNGCIRLSDPRAMAAAVLGWDNDRVTRRLAGKHGRENLEVKVPVYVAYFTAWPDQTGIVRYYNDTYSRDTKVQAAIEKVAALRAAGV